MSPARTFILTGICTLCVAINPARAGTVTLEGEIRSGRDAGLDPGDLRISRIAFEVTAGTTVVFDALAWEDNADLNQDGFVTAFDSEMSLLDSTGRRLALNDDYSGPLDQNGSATSLDSLIYYRFEESGEYLVAMGQVLQSHVDAYRGYQSDTILRSFGSEELDWAAWTVDLRWQNGEVRNIRLLDDGSSVPEPSCLIMIWSSLGTFAFLTLRRRTSATAI